MGALTATLCSRRFLFARSTSSRQTILNSTPFSCRTCIFFRYDTIQHKQCLRLQQGAHFGDFSIILRITVRALRFRLAEALLDLYKFLTTLHISEEALKIPPPEGWPEETIRKHFRTGEKDEAVIELLRYIPYIRSEWNGNEYQIFGGSVCNDFSGPPIGSTEPSNQQMDACESEPLRLDRGRHLATIAKFSGGWDSDGCWKFCDMISGAILLTGQNERLMTLDNDPIRLASPEMWVRTVKEKFRRLEVFPKDSRKVRFEKYTSTDQMEKYREVFVRHGWPGEGYKKEECLAALRQLRLDRLTKLAIQGPQQA